MTDGNNPYAPPPPAGEGPTNPTHNPYAPPEARLGASVGGTVDNAELIRRQHLSQEASVRSVGCIYYWYGIMVMAMVGVLFVTVAFAVLVPSGGQNPNVGDMVAGIGVIFGICCLFGALGYGIHWCGKGLRNLEDKVRAAVTFLAVIGLIGFPIGTLFSLYVLYVLHSEKGKRVLSASYRQVVAQTPHIKYKTPLWVWVLAILFLVFFILALFGNLAAA